MAEHSRAACLTIALSALLATFPLHAQYAENVEVRVANVDVVVTDASGKPVRGLTKADFELYENGQLQAITNFSAIESTPAGTTATAPAVAAIAQPEEAPRKAPPRMIVLFVDIGDIEPGKRKEFFDGIKSFFHSAFREGDVATVMMWNHRLRVLLEPTSELRYLDAVLASLGSPFGSNEAEITRRMAEMNVEQAARDAAISQALGTQSASDPVEEAAFQQFMIDEERCAAIKRKVSEVRNALASFSRIDMQKIMIFASDDVSLLPVRDCPLRGDFDALADTANAYGITIHAFHPSGARENTNGPDRGGFLPSARAGAPLADQYARTFDESGGLDVLAKRTGGVSGVGSLQSVKMLEKAAIEIDAYYSLGYRIAPGHEDKPRSIKVVAKNSKYRVRTRQTAVYLSESRRIDDMVAASLYLPEHKGPQTPAFDAVAGAATRKGRFRLVPIELTIRARDLALLPSDNGKVKGSFSVFVAGGREFGDASDVVELKQDFEADAKKDDDSHVTYTFSSRVRPDTRHLSIAVRDNVTGEIAFKLVTLKPQ